MSFLMTVVPGSMSAAGVAVAVWIFGVVVGIGIFGVVVGISMFDGVVAIVADVMVVVVVDPEQRHLPNNQGHNQNL